MMFILDLFWWGGHRLQLSEEELHIAIAKAMTIVLWFPTHNFLHSLEILHLQVFSLFQREQTWQYNFYSPIFSSLDIFLFKEKSILKM